MYLLYIGKVKDLRKSLKLDSSYGDDDLVYKYGITRDIRKRLAEHERDYGKTNLGLLT